MIQLVLKCVMYHATNWQWNYVMYDTTSNEIVQCMIQQASNCTMYDTTSIELCNV